MEKKQIFMIMLTTIGLIEGLSGDERYKPSSRDEACNLTHVCTSCENGYYLSDYTCRKCADGCAFCTSPDQCVECEDRYYNSGGFSGHLKCTPCAKGCQDGMCNKDGSCSCRTQYDGNNCDQCSSGWFGTENGCQNRCQQNCSTCNSYFDCTSCNNGYYLSGHTCPACADGCAFCTSLYQCIQCKHGYYNSGGFSGRLQCTPCAKGCQNGVCNSDGSCSCRTHYDGNKCDQCVNGSYGTESGCQNRCQQSCSSCNSYHECTSCNNGYYLSGNTCPACADGCASCTALDQCIQCKNGYYISSGFSGRLQCTPCAKGCQNGVCNKDGSCSCMTHYDGNKCDQCVNGSYGTESGCQNRCQKSCLTCNSYHKCTSCNNGYYLSGNTCPTCADGCAFCTSLHQCIQCKHGYYNSGGFSGRLQCTPCAKGCQNGVCNSDGSCSCRTHYDGNKCDQCVNGSYGTESGCQNRCKQSCSTCNSYHKCTSCNNGYYLSGYTCPACANGCASCTSLDQCTSCVDGYFFHVTTCKRCMTGCAECLSRETCEKCTAGYYMFVNDVKCELCANGCKSLCNVQTGDCNCTTGFSGVRCDQCAPNIQTYPLCDQCIDGFNGIACDQTCPANCKDKVCSRHDGKCKNGCSENFAGNNCSFCKEGYYGMACDARCPENCVGGTCDQSTGYCSSCIGNFAGNKCDDCVARRYGKYCNFTCPSKCGNDTCARSTGVCDSCFTEFSGDKCCLEGPNCRFCSSDSVCSECVPGKHGEKCDMECPANCANAICDKSNGTCITCKDGFRGETCILPLTAQLPPASSIPVAAIAGGAAGFVIVIILVVMVLVVFKRRSCSKIDTPKSKAAHQVNANEGENQSMSITQENVYDNITDLELPSLNAAPRKDKGMPLPTEAVSNLDSVVKLDKEAKLERFKPEMTVQPRRSNKPNKVSLEASTSLEQPPVPMVSEPDYRAEADENEYYNSAASLKKGIPVSELARYVIKKPSAFFSTEFEKLPKGLVKSTAAALLDQNIGKNRYNEIYPYDETRVILAGPGSDFINACYIEGYHRKRGYIASLGPIAKATADYKTFWRMVWQEKTEKIVMVTNLMECGVMKCEQYWPDKNATLVYGDVIVTGHSADVYAEYTVRSFTVCKGKEQRTLHHIHYTAWPDKGVPDDVTSLVEFRNKVNSTKTELNGPIIVHCSAGVGRTGTYIALDILTLKGKDKGQVDIFDCVEKLRQQRTSMVQTDEQYEYLHRALVHTLTLGSEAIPADRFQAYTTSLSDAIFYLLSHCTEKVSDDEKEAIAQNQSYKTYNRPGADIPGNMNRPRLYLDRTTEDNNYINGIFINSFKRKNQFILTQTPLPNTVDDFLTLVVQENCFCIVSMDAPDVRDKTIGTYFPADNQILNTNAYEVRSKNMDNNQSYCQRTLTIASKKTSSTVTVQHFLCVNWPNKAKAPKSPPEFLGFVQQIQKVADASTQFSPVIIHCRTGSERSAIICVVLNLLQKIEIEHEVSVINTVRQVRVRRSKAIPNKEQFKFCHQCVSAYLQSFDIYSNFS